MPSLKPAFRHLVLSIVKDIPKGSTLTYKEVANLAGSPRAYRAVGTILSHNFDPAIPCHRVIRSDGGIGEYNRGKHRKRELLMSEQDNFSTKFH